MSPASAAQVFGSSADMFGDRLACRPITEADPPAVLSHAQFDESVIGNQNALQPVQLVAGQGRGSGGLDCLGPSCNPVCRWPFALDLERGAAVTQQQERRSAADDIRVGSTDHRESLCIEPQGLEGRDLRRLADQRAEVRRAGEVVTDLVPG